MSKGAKIALWVVVAIIVIWGGYKLYKNNQAKKLLSNVQTAVNTGGATQTAGAGVMPG